MPVFFKNIELNIVQNTTHISCLFDLSHVVFLELLVKP